MSSSRCTNRQVRIDFNRVFGTIQFINLSRDCVERTFALFAACNSFYFNFFDSEENALENELLLFMRAFLFFLPIVFNFRQWRPYFSGRNNDSVLLSRWAHRLQHFPALGRVGSVWGLHLPQSASVYRSALQRNAATHLSERLVYKSFPHAVSGGWYSLWFKMFANKVESASIPGVRVVPMGHLAAILFNHLANHLLHPEYRGLTIPAHRSYLISCSLIRCGGFGFAEDFCSIAGINYNPHDTPRVLSDIFADFDLEDVEEEGDW
uniref:Putative RNA silencing suppressor protein n=1 Tax=Groundnut rosette assistor virus TaxID=33761 RepID=A0A6B9I567_9VIRU|nr:putative RNA silencing suppressor protein [Groundnut rosette assistor virus]